MVRSSSSLEPGGDSELPMHDLLRPEVALLSYMMQESRKMAADSIRRSQTLSSQRSQQRVELPLHVTKIWKMHSPRGGASSFPWVDSANWMPSYTTPDSSSSQISGKQII